MASGETLNRRGYLQTLIYGLWSIMAAALGAPAAAYLLAPPRAHREAEWVEAAALDQLEAGIPQEVVFRRTRADGWKIVSEKATAWVLKKPDSQVVAYAPQCTHLGCAYHWEEQKQQFLCPCHSSTFSPEGAVLSGPAPRPLDRYQVRVDGNKLLLGPLARPQGPAV